MKWTGLTKKWIVSKTITPQSSKLYKTKKPSMPHAWQTWERFRSLD